MAIYYSRIDYRDMHGVAFTRSGKNGAQERRAWRLCRLCAFGYMLQAQKPYAYKALIWGQAEYRSRFRIWICRYERFYVTLHGILRIFCLE